MKDEEEELEREQKREKNQLMSFLIAVHAPREAQKLFQTDVAEEAPETELDKVETVLLEDPYFMDQGVVSVDKDIFAQYMADIGTSLEDWGLKDG